MLDSQLSQYFHELESGAPLRCLDIFRSNIHTRFSSSTPPSILVQDFCRAARAVSLEPKINPDACAVKTLRAHHILSRKTLSFSETLEDRWNLLSADDLEKILLAHKRIQTIPSQQTLEKWLSVTYNKLGEMGAGWLGKSISHLADLGVYPSDEWMKSWVEALKPKSADLGWENGFRVLYKLALLDYLRQNSREYDLSDNKSPCTEAADMFLDFLEKRHASVFKDKVDNRVYYAALWFKRDFINGLPIEEQTSSSSRLERSVLNQVSDAKLEVYSDGIKIEQIGRKVDLRVRFHLADIGCEVDGILHFMFSPANNPKEGAVMYNTSTRFHAALTKELRPDLKILRVPYFTLNDAKGTQIPWEKIFGKVHRSMPSHFSLDSGSSIRDVSKSGYIFKGRTL